MKLRVALIVAVVATIAVVTAVIVTRDRNDHDVAVAGVDDSTTTSSTTTSRTTSVVDSTTTSTATTSTTTTSEPRTTTSEAAQPAPRCVRLDAATANALSASVCQVGASVAGRPPTLHLTASDGDARVRNDCGSPEFSWGDEPDVTCAIGCAPSDKPSGPSSIEVTRVHTYANPGSYSVRVTIESNCGDQPYGERQTLELEVTVS